MTRAGESNDYTIKVSAAAAQSQWSVTGARGVVMTGTSPTALAAERSGAIAVGALRALDRIARRRF